MVLVFHYREHAVTGKHLSIKLCPFHSNVDLEGLSLSSHFLISHNVLNDLNGPRISLVNGFFAIISSFELQCLLKGGYSDHGYF